MDCPQYTHLNLINWLIGFEWRRCPAILRRISGCANQKIKHQPWIDEFVKRGSRRQARKITARG
jgi:hypothetical protein